MFNLKNVKTEMRGIWYLAFPIIAGHVVQMLMGLVDLWMVGKIGKESILALAIVAFGNSAITVFYLFGIGMLVPIAILTSHAHGSGNKKEAGEVLRHGLILSAIISTSLALFLHFGYPLLEVLQQPRDVFENARVYTSFVAWSMVPTLIAVGIKQCSEALSRPWIPFFIMFASVGVNAFLNWIFIYGNLGAPAMGVDGAGLATFLARIIAAIAIVIYFLYSPVFVEEMPERWFAKINWKRMKSLWGIGLPSSIQMVAESGAFTAAAFMIGWLGKEALASHQIALAYTSFAFMFPLGLAGALTIRLGQISGAGEHDRQREVFWGAIVSGVFISIMSTIVFLCFRHNMAALIADKNLPEAASVIALAANIMVVAALFQLVDGIQIICLGALRGLKDVKKPMHFSLFCYWIVALPIGAIFAFKLGQGTANEKLLAYCPEWILQLNVGFGFGPVGIWIGLAFGIGCAAIVLFRRFWKRTA